jgi:hypothetical protein
MRLHLASILAGLALAVPAASWADPPAHAPAHGYRNKHKSHDHHSGGVEIVFDSERGVHVAVGFPDVFFHEGRYYRNVGGSWQVSVKVDSGWSVVASGGVPAKIHKAHKHHPGPAKVKHKKK